jgi:uncharacterized protein (TIRG00374 family)
VKRLPRWLRNPWLWQIFIAVSLVALAIWQTDTGKIADSLQRVRPEWLLAALLIYMTLRFLQAGETRIALSKVGHIRIFPLYGVLFVGSLVNALLPANMGDVAKVQIMANRFGLPRAGLVASRGAESVVNAFMFVVFVLIGLVLARGQDNGASSQLVLAAVSLTFCSVLIAVAVFMPKELPAWRWLRHLPDGFENSLRYQWPGIHGGFEAVRRPRLLSALLLLNVVGWLFEVSMYWAYGHAFNLDVPLGAYVSVAVVVALVTTFPITFGNVGSWEVGLIAALRIYDVPADEALAYAVGVHVFVALFNIGLGLIAMLLLGLRPRDILRVKGSPDQPIPAITS